MKEDDKRYGSLMRFWFWPWLLGAFVLRFRLNSFHINDAPAPWSVGERLLDFAERWCDALVYLAFFITSALVHRYRTQSRRPSIPTIVLLCILMLTLLKTFELQVCLQSVLRKAHIPVHLHILP